MSTSRPYPRIVLGSFDERLAAESAGEALRGAEFEEDALGLLGLDRAFAGQPPAWLGESVRAEAPGLGRLLVGGPLIPILERHGLSDGNGGLRFALEGLGIPSYEARRHEARLGEGAFLVGALCVDPQELRRASEALDLSGARDVVSSRPLATSQDEAAFDDPRLGRSVDYPRDQVHPVME